MNCFTLKLTDKQIEKLIYYFKDYIKNNPNEYIKYFIQKDDLTISIYSSNKTVFQGKDAFFYAQSYLETKDIRQAGSDEVGTGDYFGPVVVVASIVEVEDFDYIRKNKITDSKAMNDETILNIGEDLIKRFKHSLLILDNQKYNEVHKTNNLNAIKAKMHNQAYLNLINKGYDLPKECVIDQFCESYRYFSYLENEKNVFKDLIFETKAESNYPAVAVSSVIARYAFLKYMESLNKKYEFDFPLGAGDVVDIKANDFVKKYGFNELNKVCKLHFKNTDNIDEVL